jgi:hypothetical protein
VPLDKLRQSLLVHLEPARFLLRKSDPTVGHRATRAAGSVHRREGAWRGEQQQESGGEFEQRRTLSARDAGLARSSGRKRMEAAATVATWEVGADRTPNADHRPPRASEPADDFTVPKHVTQTRSLACSSADTF